MADAHVDMHRHVKAYIGVFIALAVFTVLTVAASRMEFGPTGHVLVALGIAAIKASLVAAIFMHLKWERSISIWWVLAICAIFFFALMLLPLFSFQDHTPNTVMSSWG
ncbi:MAG: cytochrome-c oxidase [Planctomycetota bacterium]|nr:MAG: cytochrome-c oxidase [Planctomycetota bacterium]